MIHPSRNPRGAAADGPGPRSWSEAEDLSLRLWIALARCYATVAREVTGRVAEYGLTTPQFGVLEALYHLGPLSLGELAEKLLVTGGNITFVMDRLEREGLVRRDRSGPDRRVVTARLTRRGRDLVRDVFPGHASFIHELTCGLTRRESERLRTLLKKWGKAIPAQAGGAGATTPPSDPPLGS
ncbi:MAG: MarR family transcriptional regulator [Longimicrobiales bacterium]|nr:MarR family transcriptional regulator [Longimicrobiales bacterium]